LAKFVDKGVQVKLTGGRQGNKTSVSLIMLQRWWFFLMFSLRFVW